MSKWLDSKELQPEIEKRNQAVRKKQQDEHEKDKYYRAMYHTVAPIIEVVLHDFAEFVVQPEKLLFFIPMGKPYRVITPVDKIVIHDDPDCIFRDKPLELNWYIKHRSFSASAHSFQPGDGYHTPTYIPSLAFVKLLLDKEYQPRSVYFAVGYYLDMSASHGAPPRFLAECTVEAGKKITELEANLKEGIRGVVKQHLIRKVRVAHKRSKTGSQRCWMLEYGSTVAPEYLEILI